MLRSVFWPQFAIPGRGGEPAIHAPELWLWIPGSRPQAESPESINHSSWARIPGSPPRPAMANWGENTDRSIAALGGENACLGTHPVLRAGGEAIVKAVNNDVALALADEER